MNRGPLATPSGRNVVAGLIAALLVFAVTHRLPLPGSLHDVMTKNGGQKILDLQPTFSSEGVYQRLSSFGESGRDAYLRMLLSTDIIFPLVLTTFLGLLARYAVAKTQPRPPMRHLMLWLPLGYLVPDLAENLSIAWLIQDYPNRHHSLAGAIGYITTLKRICMYAALFLPLLLLARNRIRSGQLMAACRPGRTPDS